MLLLLMLLSGRLSWTLPVTSSTAANNVCCCHNCLPAAAASGREVVVDPASDEFYRSHKFANYGEVGLSVKELVDKFSSQSAAHKQVSVVSMCCTVECSMCSAQAWRTGWSFQSWCTRLCPPEASANSPVRWMAGGQVQQPVRCGKHSVFWCATVTCVTSSDGRQACCASCTDCVLRHAVHRHSALHSAAHLVQHTSCQTMLQAMR
jgi:hypothetical protein